MAFPMLDHLGKVGHPANASDDRSRREISALMSL